MRLQKFLAQAGICSRRKGEVYITQGLVQVNGKKVTALGTKIDIETDRVVFNSRVVELPRDRGHIYIALNKPTGVVSSCSHRGERIILDYVNIKERIYPVGRLDKDSCGLILLTDDGDLHNTLSHPSFNHEKEYVVTTTMPVTAQAIKKMAQGIVLDGKRTRKAMVRKISDFSFHIVLKQGINRQIRRMVKKTGNEVKTLKRIRMGNISLATLKQGQWRYLKNEEVNALKSLSLKIR